MRSPEHRDLRLPAAEQGRGVASQVAFARRESPARGRRLLGLAHALVAELPHTLAAMEAGALSEWRATLIARETTCLSRDDRARVDQLVCAPDASVERAPTPSTLLVRSDLEWQVRSLILAA